MVYRTHDQEQSKDGDDEKQQLTVVGHLWASVCPVFFHDRLWFIGRSIVLQNIFLLKSLDRSAAVRAEVGVVWDLSPTMLTLDHFFFVEVAISI